MIFPLRLLTSTSAASSLRSPSASPAKTSLVFGSLSRKSSEPVAGSPFVAMVRLYSVEPGTCFTDEVCTATIASSLLPRWPSPKFVNAVLAV